jgi:hypothetical protein
MKIGSIIKGIFEIGWYKATCYMDLLDDKISCSLSHNIFYNNVYGNL